MDATLLDSEHSFRFATKTSDPKERIFDLDVRLIKAVNKLGFTHPTIVQSKCIPLALNGKDLLVRARTGSGKTIAYALPMLQKILSAKDVESQAKVTRAIVLVPSKELVAQTAEQLNTLVVYCRDCIEIIGFKDEMVETQKRLIESSPDVLVTTPGRLARVLEVTTEKILTKIKKLVETIVIDEADLIFSYGYEKDIERILKYLPKVCQAFLMSATLSEDVSKLKNLILHNPVVVKLEECETDGKLAQWYVALGDDDKDLLLFALLRLKLIQGKTLFFVNSIERCYRTKLLLEQFHVRSAVLNSELPVNTRHHIIDQFNKGLFDNLIATDEATAHVNIVDNSENNGKREVHFHTMNTQDDKSVEKGKRKDEYAVSRGVDFHGVKTVVNIDLPSTIDLYTHRIGRTARGGASGTALSFINIKDAEELKRLEEIKREQPTKTLQTIEGVVKQETQPCKLALDLSEIEPFRYRIEDVRRAVTRKMIQEARLQELKHEILNSERLKAHFEDHPMDANLLEHDTTLRPNKIQKSIAIIPSYLKPNLDQKQAFQTNQKSEMGGKDRNTDAGGPFGRSRAGRVKWQMRHRKGRFSKKRRKKKDPLF